MGSRRGPYQPDFPVGTRVQIRDADYLENFIATWKLHNPLQPEQVEYAGKTATVQAVGFYHGGDEIYTLQDLPGVWHEQCLMLNDDRDISLPVVLLPGLDGTGELFEALTASAPSHLRPIVIRLPQLGAYRDLIEPVRAQLPTTGRFAVVGESFSGPLALAVARMEPDRVAGVILCNSFVSPPLIGAFRFFPWSLLFAVAPPRWVIRRFFVGAAASSEMVSAVRMAIAKTPRRVLAARMRAVFTLPPASEQPRIKAPVLLLSGSRDVLVSPDPRDAQRIASRVTHKRIDAPHLLLQVAPAEAWAAISDFLAEGAGDGALSAGGDAGGPTF